MCELMHTDKHTYTHTHAHAHTCTHAHTHTVVQRSVPHPYNLTSVGSSEQLPDRGAMNYVQRMPVGVAGLISPWNLPLYLLTFKIAPCIAYGNTCVCKPSELTSLTAYMMCEVLSQAGGWREGGGEKVCISASFSVSQCVCACMRMCVHVCVHVNAC